MAAFGFLLIGVALVIKKK
ncbi:hypothetical protein [Enterococcus diestrammenae]